MKNSEIIITDADIDQIEIAMGNQIHFDFNRREIIKSMPPNDFQDIQAFPGTGKTTLLITKLGILAQKRSNMSSGICVLSFTNAAREEVQRRLGGTSYGEKLLSYPNFIGTFHSFFSDFVVKPWFRSMGIHIQTIDSSITLAMRRKMIGPNMAIDSHRNVVMEYSLKKGFTFSESSATQKRIKKIIKYSIKQGNLTYDEVIYFSNLAIKKHSEISKNISNRFPLLFIDEAQDTSLILWNLVRDSFSNSDIQAFGDSNQSIYDDGIHYSKAVIPSSPHFSILDSQRLTDKIANIANPLAISGESMKGVNTDFKNIPATIIMFNENSIANVLPTFGQLVLDNFSDEEINGCEGYECFAIGRVHKIKDPADVQKHFPANIEAYWPQYDPSNANVDKLRVKYDHFWKYVKRARLLVKKSNESESAVKMIILGLVDFLNDLLTGKKKYRLYKNPFSVFSKTLKDEDLMLLRRNIKLLLFKEDLPKKVWTEAVSNIELTLETIENFETGNPFFEWQDNMGKELNNQIESPKKRNNSFIFSHKDRQVEIKLGSIHSVKGQTHLATLLLETFLKTHDVKKILPFLEGKESKNSNDERMSLNYVALTRAKGMVCIALPESEISDKDEHLLRACGWDFICI
ncbi:UvrD-helicase domain-containing protein [Lactiplantibacillus plantarum]